MAKPVRHAEWALLSNTGAVEGLPNKEEPAINYKNYGQDEYEILPRQYINDTLNLNDLWNKHFEVEIDALNEFKDKSGFVDVVEASSLTLSKDLANRYYVFTGTVITVGNVVSVGGGVEQIGSTIKVRTSSATTMSLDAGATVVGYTGSIPANRLATFTIENIPSGTGTQWSCAISAGA